MKGRRLLLLTGRGHKVEYNNKKGAKNNQIKGEGQARRSPGLTQSEKRDSPAVVFLAPHLCALYCIRGRGEIYCTSW